MNVLVENEPFICRGGHPIPTDQWAWPHGGVRCRFKIPPGNVGICGIVYYMLTFPGSVRVIVECSSSELHTMQKAHMNIDEARIFLGLRWTRAA